jgi:uncharacterized delta-60 repeat protein
VNVEKLERRIVLAARELDLSFGQFGVVSHAIDATVAPLTMTAVDSGKLLVSGQHVIDYALTRFNDDGTLDTSFGGGDGTVTGTFESDGGDSAIEQITPLSGGKLLVSGYLREMSIDPFSEQLTTSYRYFVRRLLADGSPDSSFATVELPSSAAETRVVRSPSALPDGRAVVLDQGSLYGLTSSGTLDQDFGGTGNAFAQLIVNEIGRAIVGIHVLDDGKILASDGQTLARFNADGTLDDTFAQGGMAVHDLGFLAYDGAMQLGDDGSVTVVTSGVYTDPGAPTAVEQHVVRFLANGSLDASFGEGGHVTVVFPSSITARPPVFAPDGSIILCGREAFHETLNEERVWMRRVKADGSIDEDFGLVLQRDFQFAAAVMDAQGGLISVGEQHQLSDTLVMTRLAEDDPQAAGTLTVSGGVASMQGTGGRDQIEFRMTGDVIAITRNTWGKAFALGTINRFEADGGDGDDVIIAANNFRIPADFDGGNGFDRLGGGPANDTLAGGAQRDWIAGAGGADLLIGNGGNDVIQGGGGADHIYGGGGNDTLLGNGGNDLLNAGGGQNRLLGGGGDDTFFAANSAADTIFGDAGRDTAHADELLDELHGVES